MYQVPFLKSLVWRDLGLNPGLSDHWRTHYSLEQWWDLFLFLDWKFILKVRFEDVEDIPKKKTIKKQKKKKRSFTHYQNKKCFDSWKTRRNKCAQCQGNDFKEKWRFVHWLFLSWIQLQTWHLLNTPRVLKLTIHSMINFVLENTASVLILTLWMHISFEYLKWTYVIIYRLIFEIHLPIWSNLIPRTCIYLRTPQHEQDVTLSQILSRV